MHNRLQSWKPFECRNRLIIGPYRRPTIQIESESHKLKGTQVKSTHMHDDDDSQLSTQTIKAVKALIKP